MAAPLEWVAGQVVILGLRSGNRIQIEFSIRVQPFRMGSIYILKYKEEV